MKKVITAVAAVIAAVGVQGAIIYTDDFSGATLNSEWNNNVGTPASLDTVNQQLDYNHTAGTSRRFMSYNPSVLNGSQTGYFKADISNHAGADRVWMAFVGSNPGNNNHYAKMDVTGNGTYEMFINNTAGSLAFDNGNGWTGTLAAGTGIVSRDGGDTSEALTYRNSFTTSQNIFGFGFVNFGNASAFPTQSFSVDNVVVANTLAIPEPASIGLIGLFGGGMLFIRRRFKV